MQFERRLTDSVRGTREEGDRNRHCRRFIPARAGNASPQRPMRPIRSVHPRACGERGFLILVLAFETGSSPRVRGTLNLGVDAWMLRRFIPARAGNAKSCRHGMRCCSVHPRACGERLIQPAGGHLWSVHPRACGERFSKMMRGPGCSGSSPRVRGTLEKRPAFLLEYGSSPRVRGTLRTRSASSCGQRFIPARAGNASASMW